MGWLLLVWMTTSPYAAQGSTPVPRSKYEKPSIDEILVNRALALDLGETTRKSIVGTMHLVETPHFLIFTAWNPSNDAFLSQLCERMFQTLSQQFKVPSTETVWIGKCPIYLFWDPAHYDRFISEIDHSRQLDANMSHANGYHATRGYFSYIVINGVSQFGATLEQAKTRFFHVLVHEGTHAFLNRYLTDRSMPLWIEEGLADFMAATLVPLSEANQTYITASLAASARPEVVERLFEKTKSLSPNEYALAQSVIRYLNAQGPSAFVRFLELLKDGKREESALADTFHVTNRELVRYWALFWQRNSRAVAHGR